MDSIHGLVSVHVNMGKLEKEIKKCRRSLIKGYASNNCNVYILKISYAGFAEQLKKETAKFEKLLQDLDVTNDQDINAEAAEIMENIESDSESTGSDREFAALYRDSVPMTDSLSIDEPQIKMQHDEKEEKKQDAKPVKPPIKNNKIKPVQAVNIKKRIPPKSTNNSKLNKNVVSNTKKVTNNVAPKNVRPSNRKQKKVGKILNGKNNRNEPKLGTMNNNNNNNMRPVPFTKHMIVVNNVESMKVKKVKKATKTGYNNRTRKGFEVYKNKPIYGSTLLFCHETCGENKSKLRKYLIKYGDFGKLKIEGIIFKTKYDGIKYALIRVRGSLIVIEHKMDILNRQKGDMYNDVIHLFERNGYNDNDKKQRSKDLYVNNFDILDEESHKRFTDLFQSYGELKQYVVMGIDKNNDPFAIIQFKHLKHAKEWVAWNGKTKFDGKVLNINYSKY